MVIETKQSSRKTSSAEHELRGHSQAERLKNKALKPLENAAKLEYSYHHYTPIPLLHLTKFLAISLFHP